MERFDAIILAGGAASRLGGVDKAMLDMAGDTLLQRTLRAVADADRVVVVGPPRGKLQTSLGSPFRTAQEEPPGGGPVAALAAGLTQVTREVVVALACDMPFIDAVAIGRLVSQLDECDAAVFVDPSGRRQYLAAAYRRIALARALEQVGSPHGASMRQLLQPLTIRDVPADPETTLDCDTWDDIHRSRRILEEQ